MTQPPPDRERPQVNQERRRGAPAGGARGRGRVGQEGRDQAEEGDGEEDGEEGEVEDKEAQVRVVQHRLACELWARVRYELVKSRS